MDGHTDGWTRGGRWTRSERQTHTEGRRGRALAWVAIALVAAVAGPCGAGPRPADAASPAPSAGPTSAGPNEVAIAVAGGRLTARIAGASLGDTLRALGASVPLRITVRGEAPDVSVWADMSGIEIEEGVRRLLRGSSYLLVHGEGPEAERGTPRLIEIVVLGHQSREGRRETEPAPPPGAVVSRPRRDTVVARARNAADERRAPLLDDDALGDIARHDPDAGRRLAALESLGRPGMSERSAEVFEAALEDFEASVRLRALEVLRDLGTAPRIPAMSWVLRTDPSPAVRRMAAVVLAAVPDPARRELAHDLLADSDPDVRAHAQQLIETPASLADLAATGLDTLRSRLEGPQSP